MQTTAVILCGPRDLDLGQVPLDDPSTGDAVVDIRWSGISTGTERLLWSGEMPHFPGMGYPLVPGYEAIGMVSLAAPETGLQPGDMVFVPGASCFGPVNGLFGAAARRVVTPASRLMKVDPGTTEDGTLLALAATAHHAVCAPDGVPPDLIVGHGVLGRLIARVAIAKGWPAPRVLETAPERLDGALGYEVCRPEEDSRSDYKKIIDATGDPGILDSLIGRLSKGGEVVLAGFYSAPVSFSFPPAFMREARLRVAAEWTREDLYGVRALVDRGALPLGGLISHLQDVRTARDSYQVAFTDRNCLKMILDWRSLP